MRGALVVAPLRPAKMVWPAEFRKWTEFHGLSVGVLHGDKKQKVLEEDHDIYVINHAGLPWLFGMDKPINPKTGKPVQAWRHFLTPAGKLLMSKVNILVLDELSKFKNTDTQRFKIVKPWLHKFDRRYGLTGSPAANGLLDLFGQCFVLDGGRSLGQYVTHYREAYFMPVDDEAYTWRPKFGAEEKIYDRIAPLALRMAAEDHMKLPLMRPYAIKLDLPPKVRSTYEDVEEDFLTILQSEILTAPNAAAANMMCRQICSGAVYTAQVDPLTGIKKTGPRKWLHLHDEKLDAMEDLMDELNGQQVLIAYEFQHDLERILKRWPDMPVFGQSDKKDAMLERAWNAGLLPRVAGHPQSIGHGLNLQDSSAHNIIWFTLTWDYELYDQFNRRLMRQGNAAKYLNCYHLIVRDSVEESVLVALKQKKRTQDSLMLALQTRARLDE